MLTVFYVCGELDWYATIVLLSISDTWNMPAKSKIYLLGQTVNLQVSASQLPSGGKVYISSCFATPYSSASPLRYALIDNFGYVLGTEVVPHNVSTFAMDSRM